MYKRIRNLYFVTLFIGSVGYILGLLTASKSGKDFRREIETTGRKNLINLEKQLKAQYSDLNNQLQVLENNLDASSKVVAEKINKYIVDVKKMQKKSKILLSALHDGTAEDDELIQVIDEINNLKSSIKKYFKHDN